MYCSNCGRLIEDNSTECYNCGTPMKKQVQIQIEPQKKKSKLPILIIVLVVLLYILISLIKYATSDNSSNTNSNNYANTTKAPKISTQATTIQATTTQEAEKQEAATQEVSLETATKKQTDQKKLIYDDNSIKVYYKDMTKNSYKTQINVLIENNSDKDICVQVRDFSINGFMINELFSPTISAGKKINDSIDVYNKTLEENGIEDINNIELSFHIFDWNSWTDSFDTDKIYMEW